MNDSKKDTDNNTKEGPIPIWAIDHGTVRMPTPIMPFTMLNAVEMAEAEPISSTFFLFWFSRCDAVEPSPLTLRGAELADTEGAAAVVVVGGSNEW